MYTTYTLTEGENGLYCDENGLAYDGQILVCKSRDTGRFGPCSLNAIYKEALADRRSSIQAVANALNKGNVAGDDLCCASSYSLDAAKTIRNLPSVKNKD